MTISLPRWISTGPASLIAVWVIGMISLPIFLWTLGDALLPWVVSVNVVILATANIALLIRDISPAALARVLSVVLIGSWFIEYLGSTTGFPFSHYDYTPRLQPQIAGVPAIIPLAWLMMLPASWAIGQLIAPKSRIAQTLIAALAMTAWDLFLDPQMVAWDFWRWASPGGYFGIPWVNFAGWFVSAFALTLLAHPPKLNARPYLVIYTLTWALQTIGLAIFWAMPGPALVGFIGMGGFVVLAWRRELSAPTATRQV